MKQEKIYYDLDGTLSTLNNSYDFSYTYHLFHKNYLRYTLIRIVHFLLEKLFFINYAPRRKVILMTMFYNTKEENLKDFFEQEYKKEFMMSLTSLGKKALKQQKGIILTGCTHIPAEQIGKLFGMKTISTHFKIKNGRVKGILQDTFGHLKEQFIPKTTRFKTIYYTDDPKSEANLKKLFDEFKVVP